MHLENAEMGPSSLVTRKQIGDMFCRVVVAKPADDAVTVLNTQLGDHPATTEHDEIVRSANLVCELVCALGSL